MNQWERYMDAGGAAFAEGQYAEAENCFRSALTEAEKFGPKDTRLAQSLNDLALVFCLQERYEEAKPLYVRFLQIWEKAVGPPRTERKISVTNEDVIATLRELGYDINSHSSSVDKAAIGQLISALNKKKQQQPNFAASLSNMATLYDSKGEYAKAEQLYKRGLELMEKSLGLYHPEVASGLENYAKFLRKTNRAAEAKKLEKRAKAIRDGQNQG